MNSLPYLLDWSALNRQIDLNMGVGVVAQFKAIIELLAKNSHFGRIGLLLGVEPFVYKANSRDLKRLNRLQQLLIDEQGRLIVGTVGKR